MITKLEKISTLLDQIKRPENIVVDKTYKILGAHWYGKGLYIKEIKLGSEIKAQKIFRVHKGDFVYNRLFAWKGSFSLVEDDVDNCYVTNEFPCFNFDSTVVNPRYLWYYFCQSSVWAKVQKLSSGGSANSRNRLKEEKFLSMEIELPEIPDQDGIVEKINLILEKIKQLQTLKSILDRNIDLLKKQSYEQTFTIAWDYKTEPLSQIMRKSNIQISTLDEKYSRLPYLSLENIEANTGRMIGVKSAKESGIRGTAVLFDNKHVLYSKLRPYLNKVITPDFRGCGTTELVVFEPDPKINKNYLTSFLRHPKFVKDADKKSTGQKMPRTNMKWFDSVPIPIPPVDIQEQISDTLETTNKKIYDLMNMQKQVDLQLEKFSSIIIEKIIQNELNNNCLN